MVRTGLPMRRALTAGVALAVMAAVVTWWTVGSSNGQPSRSAASSSTQAPVTQQTPPTTTTTTIPLTQTTAPLGSTGPVTSPPLAAPGPGFVSGQVSAVGDSVMEDYSDPLKTDIPGVSVDATVSRQWSDGETVLQGLKAQGQLGAVVIVGLGSNGPITSDAFTAMMGILNGASRVVFVNTHVGQPWQDQVNQVLAAGVQQYPNTILVDWASLANANPSWLYSDGTHLPIDGTGATALAALIASQV
jgi:hypothetical protein